MPPRWVRHREAELRRAGEIGAVSGGVDFESAGLARGRLVVETGGREQARAVVPVLDREVARRAMEARGHGLEVRWAVETSDRAVVLDVEPAGPVTHLITRALAPG